MSRLMFAAVLALAAALPAHAAPKPAPRDAEVDWLRRPNADELQAAFPVGLRGDGKATIHCRVNVQGLLENCSVVAESPKGKGVGGAALLLAPNFLMRPAMKDGKPVVAEVSIPVNFSGGSGLTGPKVISLVHPLWIGAPTAAQMAAAYPKGGPAKGHAAMRCRLKADGSLSQCEVLTEEPKNRGFGWAAKSLAPRFRAYTDPAKADYKNVRVTVALAFEAAPGGPRFITAPDWRKHPSEDQVIAVYPDKAVKDGFNTGHATAQCLIKPDGTLADCRAVEETPADEGFGEAATRLAGVMSIGLWSQDGKPVDGAQIRIPFRFNYARAAEAKSN